MSSVFRSLPALYPISKFRTRSDHSGKVDKSVFWTSSHHVKLHFLQIQNFNFSSIILLPFGLVYLNLSGLLFIGHIDQNSTWNVGSGDQEIYSLSMFSALDWFTKLVHNDAQVILASSCLFEVPSELCLHFFRVSTFLRKTSTIFSTHLKPNQFESLWLDPSHDAKTIQSFFWFTMSKQLIVNVIWRNSASNWRVLLPLGCRRWWILWNLLNARWTIVCLGFYFLLRCQKWQSWPFFQTTTWLENLLFWP